MKNGKKYTEYQKRQMMSVWRAIFGPDAECPDFLLDDEDEEGEEAEGDDNDER